MANEAQADVRADLTPNGDSPDDVRFIKIVWNKTTDQFGWESNVTGRIDVIGMLGFAKLHLLAELDKQHAQNVVQERRIVSAVNQPLRTKGS